MKSNVVLWICHAEVHIPVILFLVFSIPVTAKIYTSHIPSAIRIHLRCQRPSPICLCLFFIFMWRLIALFIHILNGFMCALVSGRLIGKETGTLSAFTDNLETVIQRYSRSITLHHDTEKPHRRQNSNIMHMLTG